MESPVASRRGNDKFPRGQLCVWPSMEDTGNSFILWSRHGMTRIARIACFFVEKIRRSHRSHGFLSFGTGMLQPSLPFSGHGLRVDWGLMVCICLHRPSGPPSFLSELDAFRFDIVWYCYLWRICDLPWPQHWKKVRSRQGLFQLLRSERSGVTTRNNGMAGIGTGEVGI